MPECRVSRSIHIEKSVEKTIDYISDFTTWPKWSPWLILEPNSEVTFSTFQQQPGAYYTWKGKRIGQGRMELAHLYDNQLVYRLHFLKPFKSHAEVRFNLTPSGSGCKVEWQYRGHLPWYLFFLKSFIRNMLRMDYDRGLRMLKSALETGRVDSKVRELGERVLPETHYIGVWGSATLDEIATLAKRHTDNLNDYVALHNIKACGEQFTLYQFMSMRKRRFDFITCLPVSEPMPAAEKFVAGTIPAGLIFAVEHQGEYQFLGNAWAFAASLTRAKKFKVKSRPLGIEKYLDNPNEVAPDQLRTEVMLFKKG